MCRVFIRFICDLVGGVVGMKEEILRRIYRQFAIEQMEKHLKADNDLFAARS